LLPYPFDRSSDKLALDEARPNESRQRNAAKFNLSTGFNDTPKVRHRTAASVCAYRARWLSPTCFMLSSPSFPTNDAGKDWASAGV
jgi:hypothetical protein